MANTNQLIRKIIYLPHPKQGVLQNYLLHPDETKRIQMFTKSTKGLRFLGPKTANIGQKLLKIAKLFRLIKDIKTPLTRATHYHSLSHTFTRRRMNLYLPCFRWFSFLYFPPI